MSLTCVILAAGLGKRMNSTLPKVLHEVCGIPMLQAVINAARQLNPKKIVVVVGDQRALIRQALSAPEVAFAFQRVPKGTAHALLCAAPYLKDFKGDIVVLNGDTPLLTGDTLRKFLRHHRRDKNVLSVLSFLARQPESYGRVIRDASGRILSIIEHADADRAQRAIHEVNSGVYAMRRDLFPLLHKVRMSSKKSEYYLTDIIALAVQRGLNPAAYCVAREEECLGVNTREDLYKASSIMKRGLIQRWIKHGVNFIDTGSVFIHADVSIGKETTIYPNVYLEGKTTIGKHATIYPNVRIVNSFIGKSAVIKDSTVIESSSVLDRASVGPFAHIRPGSTVGTEARIGNFVELKKASIGKGTKANHLSYLGDASIGAHVNIGAGTITCNYDGQKKHHSIIEDGAFIGSDTQLVAPVRVGSGSYVGAGSTITKDVPPLALAISRVHQRNVKGWALKKRAAPRKKRTDGGKNPGG